MTRDNSLPSIARTLALAITASASAAAACSSPDGPANPSVDPSIPLPGDARPGDEIVATIKPSRVAGHFQTNDNPGALIELTLGKNLARHVLLPGDATPDALSVSLGAWDGGLLQARTVQGDADIAIETTVDPSAAGLPVMGLFDDRFSNDVPLGLYVEGTLFTYVLTNEDAGTGLFPTLLMARYGRPTDIEGLYRAGPQPEIQAEGHAWIPFEGPFEGTHPLLKITTLNGLVGPAGEEVYRLSPTPIDFSSQNGAIPRERVLDQAPWILAASFAEVERQLQTAKDGGPADAHIGAPDDYIFIDYQFESDTGAVLSFEALVDDAWWSSLNIWTSASDLTDAHQSGVGRTCIELPPGRAPGDIKALRAVAAGTGSGTLASARWFRYDESFVPVEVGALPAAVNLGEATATAVLWQQPQP